MKLKNIVFTYRNYKYWRKMENQYSRLNKKQKALTRNNCNLKKILDVGDKKLKVTSRLTRIICNMKENDFS